MTNLYIAPNIDLSLCFAQIQSGPFLILFFIHQSIPESVDKFHFSQISEAKPANEKHDIKGTEGFSFSTLISKILSGN